MGNWGRWQTQGVCVELLRPVQGAFRDEDVDVVETSNHIGTVG